MAETLVELIAKVSADASQLKKGLADAERGTEQSSKRMADALKKVGVAMAASGAAITAAMGLAIKSAMGAVESENLFTVSLKNNADAARKWSNDLGKSLGLNTYELRKNVGVMFTMISSMGVAEDAALDMSKGITELANDMASFYNLPTGEAFAKLRAGLTGETEPLKRLGILVDEATIKTAALTHGIIREGEEFTQTQKIQARYLAIMEQTTDAQGDLARTIDSPVNKLRILGSTFEEIRITLGEALLPAVSSLLTAIGNITRGVIDWVKENPKLAATLIKIGAALGIVLTVAGGLILILPTLKAVVAAFGVVFHAALGPIGLISLAIAGLITIGILLWRNWDKVTMFFREAWINIKQFFLEGIQSILDGLSNFTRFIPGLNSLVDSARGKIANMIEATKIEKDALIAEKALGDVGEALEETTEIIEQNTDATKEQIEAAKENVEIQKADAAELTAVLKREATQQYEDKKASLTKQRDAIKATYDAAIESIKKEYGVSADTTKALIDQARDVRDARIRYIDDALTKAKDAHKERLSQINDEYRASLSQAERILQDRIDAIDKQTSTEELALTKQAEQTRLAELSGKILTAETAEEKAEAETRWREYTAQVGRNELLRNRQAEKDALRASIEGLREGTNQVALELQRQRDAKIAIADETLRLAEALHAQETVAADIRLAEDTKRLEMGMARALRMAQITHDDALAKNAAQAKDLDINYENQIERLDRELKKFQENNSLKLEDAKLFVLNLNKELDLIKDIDYTVTRYERVVAIGGGIAPAVTPATPPVYNAFTGLGLVEGFQEGGIFRKPSIIGIGEVGPEAVIPLNEAGRLGDNIVINFTQPVFFDREDTMNRFVDMIRKGIQRQDRLRFGGAYAG